MIGRLIAWTCRGVAQESGSRWTEYPTVLFNPRDALYFGATEYLNRLHPQHGRLTITPDRFVFISGDAPALEVMYSDTQWVAQSYTLYPDHAMLIIHLRDAEWSFHVFQVKDRQMLMAALNRFCDVVVATQPDRGPVTAPRYTQDMLGHWQPDGAATLYLTHDRVLVNWRTLLLVSQIQELVVLPAPRLNLSNKTLLRIIYVADDRPRRIQFEMSDAHGFADWLHNATGIEPELASGRKKKA